MLERDNIMPDKMYTNFPCTFCVIISGITFIRLYIVSNVLDNLIVKQKL